MSREQLRWLRGCLKATAGPRAARHPGAQPQFPEPRIPELKVLLFSNSQAAELQSLVSPALARRVSPIWFGHYGAFTSDGSPVHYVKLRCDVRLFEKTCSEEELTRWYVSWMEQSLTLLNACNRPGTPAACWRGMVEVIDLSGMSFSQLHPSSLQMLSRILKMGSQHYPENLRCAYVIGAPSFFAGGWAVVSQALAPATVAKISVRSDDGGAPLATLLGGEAKLAQLRASGAPNKLEQSLAESRKSAESQATVAASGCLGCPVRCFVPPPTKLAWDSSTRPLGMLSPGLQQRFESATSAARELPVEQVSSADRLRLYGWFKQTAAPATSVAQPSRLAVTERAKWDAWHAARSLSPEAAALAYCELVSTLRAEGPAARVISRRAAASAAPSAVPLAAARSFRPLAELLMLADLEEQAGQISALRTSVHQTHLAAAVLVAAAALGTAATLAAPHVSSSLVLPHVPLCAWAATAIAALLGALGYAWLALRRPLELKLLTRAVRITWLFASVLGRYKLARVRSRRLEAKVP